MLGYLLLTLLPVAAVIYVVWAHRKRAAERAAASSKRFAEMFGTAAPSRSGMPVASRNSRASPQPLCLRKERVLDERHGALFRALVSGLPEYQIFPHISLGAVVQPPPMLQGREREQRLRALAQNTVDCLVCDRDGRAIAAVDFEDGASAESRIKSAYLAAAGLHHLRVPAAALPGPQDIRNLVLAPIQAKSA